jgi:hypothetical protein
VSPNVAEKVDAALAHHPQDGTWEALCIAAVRLGAAVAGFDRARAEYIEGRREARMRSETWTT